MARDGSNDDDDDFMDIPGRRRHGVDKPKKENFSDGQKDAAGDMGMRLLMNIRCKNLSNVLCDWLARKYNTSSRCFVIPGRGSIPLDEESVFNMLGVPRGGIDVPYKVGREVEERLFPQMFP